MIILRMLDILGSSAGLVLLSPLLVVVAAAIKLDSPGPVLFIQKRVGKDNQEFNILKFRTMYVGTPELAKDKLAAVMDRRVTRVGRMLRRTSIDELPQLINILAGDMSLVGPRPALYNQQELIRMRTECGVHRVRPGLTGLAQVMGREDLSLESKVMYDRELVERLNPVTYIGLILRTLIVVFSSRGTY